MQHRTIEELAEHVGARVEGDKTVQIRKASTLNEAGPGEITFLSNPKYESHVKETKAGAVLVKEPMETDAVQLIVADPYYAFMQVVVLLHGHRRHFKTGISKKASIARSAQIGADCHINDFVYISENAVIGKNCVLYPGVFIGPDSKIGNDCILYPNAVVYDECVLGDRVIVQAGASIGQDGFGFSTHQGVHHKIPQIGRVIIEDDVEIGSCTVIERGTLDDTIIGKGTKISDSVAIGHGAQIGPHCLLVPQVGVAGSAKLGHHCVLGGQAGVVGHIKVGNMVQIAAQAGVINDVPDGASIIGAPAIDASKARRAYALIEYLPDLRKTVRRLEKRIAQLEGKAESIEKKPE